MRSSVLIRRLETSRRRVQMSSARLARRALSNALATARERSATFASSTARTASSSSPPAAAPPCWSCDADQVTVRPGDAYDFFCASCGAIQPASSSSGVDYFQLLGVYVCLRRLRDDAMTDGRFMCPPVGGKSLTWTRRRLKTR